MSDSDENAEITEAANAAIVGLLPNKSKEVYEHSYHLFSEWCKTKKCPGKVNENILLAYFSEKSKVVKASTLWSTYSMLKATINIKHDIDISKFNKLVPFLKRMSDNYKPKKSKTFTRDEVNKFLMEAEDETYLLMKVLLITGISGAMRREELMKMMIDDIQDKEDLIVVNVPDTKTKIDRKFVMSNTEFIKYFRKYAALRPLNIETRRFFINYQKGKCTRQPVGINKIGDTPSLIAKYLKLPDTKLYTGHSFRRTSATLLVDSGGDITNLKRHGGWKTSSIAESYIAESTENKIKIANLISPNEISNEVPNEQVFVELSKAPGINEITNAIKNAGINVTNCSNCYFSFNLNK